MNVKKILAMVFLGLVFAFAGIVGVSAHSYYAPNYYNYGNIYHTPTVYKPVYYNYQYYRPAYYGVQYYVAPFVPTTYYYQYMPSYRYTYNYYPSYTYYPVQYKWWY